MTDFPPSIDAWVHADRRQDLDQMRAQLAADVVLISPLTDAFDFRGPDEVMAVFESAFDLSRYMISFERSSVHWVRAQ